MHDTCYLDTSATHHLTYRTNMINCYQVLSNPLSVTSRDNGQKIAIGKGSIQLRLLDNHEITVPNVYYVRGLTKHLLSVGQAIVHELIIQFCKENTILFFKNGNTSIQLVCPKEKHLYPNTESSSKCALNSLVDTTQDNIFTYSLWH